MSILEKLKNIPVILGSQSPRRQELLRLMDIDFSVEVRGIDEYIDKQLPAPDIVKSIAIAKLKAFDSPDYDDKLVLVSDTLVADQKGNMLGKPKDEAEAIDVLRGLSGQKHKVYTAVAMAYHGLSHVFVEITEVWFALLDDNEIRYYVDKYQPMDKAGSYGIQEWIGHIGIERIYGSYENVMGLPTARLYTELKFFIR